MLKPRFLSFPFTQWEPPCKHVAIQMRDEALQTAGKYQPECLPSVLSLSSLQEASTCLHTSPCTRLCPPLTLLRTPLGRCDPAGRRGGGGTQQQDAPKRETLCISLPAYLSSHTLHPSHSPCPALARSSAPRPPCAPRWVIYGSSVHRRILKVAAHRVVQSLPRGA